MGPEASTPITVGRYAIHRPLAAGGMATVHLGRLLGAVGFARTVAIKRLHAQFSSDPDFVAMLVDEARIAARIQHPNVVQTLDVVAAPGELLLVMEYVHGQSLSRLVRDMLPRDAPIPLPIVSAVITGMLHGLHAAHEATSDTGEPLGIVHRDVSPQNVVVGVDGVARVLDFGVAKASNRLQSTRSGQIKGKLAYMSPEQLRAKPSTRLIDVYAAGVVLWETLTRKRLFSAEDEGSLIGLVLENVVSAPSTVAPHVPPELDAIVLKLLSKEPGDRYPTARDAARAIEAVVRPALASEVGEWVAVVAQSALRDRASYVKELESFTGSESQPRTPAATPPSLAEQERTRTIEREIDRTKPMRESPSGQTGMPVTHAITPVSMGGVLPAPTPKSRTGLAVALAGAVLGGVLVSGAVIFALAVKRPAPQALAQSATSPANEIPAVVPEPERSGAPVPETSLEPPPSAVPPPVSPVSPSSPISPIAASAKPRAVAAPRPAAPPAPSASSGEDMYRRRW
ncbi:MAG: serine/threonine-protein kinase [Labilithrix sp.]